MPAASENEGILQGPTLNANKKAGRYEREVIKAKIKELNGEIEAHEHLPKKVLEYRERKENLEDFLAKNWVCGRSKEDSNLLSKDKASVRKAIREAIDAIIDG